MYRLPETSEDHIHQINQSGTPMISNIEPLEHQSPQFAMTPTQSGSFQGGNTSGFDNQLPRFGVPSARNREFREHHRLHSDYMYRTAVENRPEPSPLQTNQSYRGPSDNSGTGLSMSRNQFSSVPTFLSRYRTRSYSDAGMRQQELGMEVRNENVNSDSYAGPPRPSFDFSKLSNLDNSARDGAEDVNTSAPVQSKAAAMITQSTRPVRSNRNSDTMFEEDVGKASSPLRYSNSAYDHPFKNSMNESFGTRAVDRRNSQYLPNNLDRTSPFEEGEFTSPRSLMEVQSITSYKHRPLALGGTYTVGLAEDSTVRESVAAGKDRKATANGSLSLQVFKGPKGTKLIRKDKKAQQKPAARAELGPNQRIESSNTSVLGAPHLKQKNAQWERKHNGKAKKRKFEEISPKPLSRGLNNFPERNIPDHDEDRAVYVSPSTRAQPRSDPLGFSSMRSEDILEHVREGCKDMIQRTMIGEDGSQEGLRTVRNSQKMRACFNTIETIVRKNVNANRLVMRPKSVSETYALMSINLNESKDPITAGAVTRAIQDEMVAEYVTSGLATPDGARRVRNDAIQTSDPAHREFLSQGSVLERIEHILEAVNDAIADATVGSIPLKARKSKLLSEHDSDNDVVMTGVQFVGNAVNETRRFTILLRILELIHEALTANIVRTKRDIFYADAELFGSQTVVDRYVDKLAANFGVGRDKLNVVAAAKGLVVGPLTARKTDGTLINFASAKEGILVPDINDISQINMQSVRWILVVEKEATFRRLAAFGSWKEIAGSKGMLVTAKGYPDRSTRAFLNFIARKLVPIRGIAPPIIGLVDYDPDGLEILCTYKYGSAALAHENDNLTVPSLLWFGIRSEDLILAQSPMCDVGLLKLTKRDRHKAVKMLETEKLAEGGSSEDLRRELQVMLMLNIKAEIQLLNNMDGGVEAWLERKMLE